MKLIPVITDPAQVLRILRHRVKTGKPPPGLDPVSLNGSPRCLAEGAPCLLAATAELSPSPAVPRGYRDAATPFFPYGPKRDMVIATSCSCAARGCKSPAPRWF